MPRHVEQRYQAARRAFERAHGYPYKAGEIGHTRWLDGWLYGYDAGLRRSRRDRQSSTSGESQP